MSVSRILGSNTPPPRLNINVGAGFDIPTGTFIKDINGNDVLLGGYTPFHGTMGDPNTDKTMVMLYKLGAAANCIAYSYHSEIMGYDSEGTLRKERINSLLERFEYLDRDEYDDVIMDFHSIAEMAPETWYDKHYAPYIKAKKESKDIKIDIEFLADPNDKKKLLSIPLPTFSFLDTISYFNPSTSVDLILGELKKSAGSNDANTKTIGMNEAKFKTDIISTMTSSTLRTNTYGIVVAHVGDNISLENSPYGPKPRQQIGSLSSNEKIKGVPANFTRLTMALWQTTNKTSLYNQTTKLAEYPLGGELDTQRNDLAVITIKQHRSKDNSSKEMIEIITSQKEGVQPHLSQFRAIKKVGFGIEGNDRSYWLTLYPDVKLSRTTVRDTINNDSKLRRALELTSDLLQMTIYYPEYSALGYYCTVEELYKDIDALGYDWNKILTDTRNWWTPKQFSMPLKYLHILNLLKLRKGHYNKVEILDSLKKEGDKK